jgi:hypothetical protein
MDHEKKETRGSLWRTIAGVLSGYLILVIGFNVPGVSVPALALVIAIASFITASYYKWIRRHMDPTERRYAVSIFLAFGVISLILLILGLSIPLHLPGAGASLGLLAGGMLGAVLVWLFFRNRSPI